MKKWESISEFSKRTGMKTSTIKNLIKTGALKSEPTDGGGKIMIEVDLETTEFEKKILIIDKKLDALCKHLGINI